MDLDKISHVVNFDTPTYPENYMHRIGRTGRAKEKGKSLLFYTEKEEKYKGFIEDLMSYEIPVSEMPEAVEAGTVILVGTNVKKIVGEANVLLQDTAKYESMSKLHNPYGDGKASKRIVEFLLNK